MISLTSFAMYLPAFIFFMTIQIFSVLAPLFHSFLMRLAYMTLFIVFINTHFLCLHSNRNIFFVNCIIIACYPNTKLFIMAQATLTAKVDATAINLPDSWFPRCFLLSHSCTSAHSWMLSVVHVDKNKKEARQHTM